MNGITRENVIVKEYEIDNPLIQNIDSIIDNSIRDCHNKYFHTFDHICEYNLNFTNTTNNETVNFTISDKSMGMYELNKKLTIARGNGFYKMKNFSLSPGIEPESSSPESLISTTRPPSHNSISKYDVYMDTASASFGVKCPFIHY